MSLLKTFWLWIKVSRPGHWPILPLIFLLGLIDAKGIFNWFVLAQCLALSFPIELTINGLNDIYDQETDLNNPRKNSFWLGSVLEKKDISKVFVGSIFGTVVVLLSSLAASGIFSTPWNNLMPISAYNWENLFWTIVGLVFGIIYSIPPIRLKERPILSLSTYAFGFLSAYFMGYTLFGSTFQAGIKPWILSLLVVALGSLAFLVDYAADLKAKQITIATKFGPRISALISLFQYFVVLITRPFSSIVSLIYTVLGTAMLIFLSYKPTHKLAKFCLYILSAFGGLAIFLSTIFHI